MASFRIAEVIADYKSHRSAGGEIPLDEGLGLEQSYHVVQLAARRPLTCLLTSALPYIHDPEVPAMARVQAFRPADLVAEVQRRFRVELNTSRDIEGQLQRWGSLAPLFPAFVYDGGDIGHCILLQGIERKTGRLIYWDPWPLRSLLCAGKNKAGVAAQLVPSGEIVWAIDPAEMAQVLYSVFVPG